MPSNLRQVISISNANIWRKKHFEDSYFFKNLASFWRVSGEIWQNFYFSLYRFVSKPYIPNINLGSNFGVFWSLRLKQGHFTTELGTGLF